MNKSIIFIFLTLTISPQINAQILNNKDIIGIWKVDNIISLNDSMPDEQHQKMEMILSAFSNSKFEFKADKNFSFDFESEDWQITNGHWKYNDSTKSFIIQEWKDKDTDERKLMEVFAKREKDDIIFMISGIPLILKMEKVE